MQFQREQKRSFTPKRPMAFKILENNLGYFYFKSTKPFHLCLPVETLQRIKVRVLQNSDDFCIETSIQIHSFDYAKIFKFL